MAYFVFDMDETLANLFTVHYFLCDLRRDTMIKNMGTPPSAQLQTYLDTAYSTFVKGVAAKEAQAEPYGILRPGILTVMEQLQQYKEAGSIKGVVIYSNNAALGTLHFIRDLIHAHIGNSELVCDCIHWGHPARESERRISQYLAPKPGSALKTWNVLKTILTNGPCGAPASLEPKDVYFVDDQHHQDLYRNLPTGHYITALPYAFKTPYDPLAQLYKQCLEESGLVANPEALEEYFEYINDGCAKKKLDDIDTVIAWYKGATKTPATGTPAPSPDRTITACIQAIQSTRVGMGGARHVKRQTKLYKKRYQSRRRTHGRRRTRKTLR
jgi:hypothetical protein